MKIKCFLISMLLVLMVQSAYAIPIVKIDPDWINSAGMAKDNIFQADVRIENVHEFSGFSFDLEYDSEVLSLEKIELGDFLGSTGAKLIGPNQQDSSGGIEYGAGIFGTEKPSGSGILATLTFSVNDPDRETMLELAEVMLSYEGQINTVSYRQIFNGSFSQSPIYYSIQVVTPDNGVISPSSEEIPEKVTAGSDMIFIFTPNSCYQIKDILLIQKNGDIIVNQTSVLSESVKNEDGTASYILKDIQANYTISAEFGIEKYSVMATSGAGGTILPSGSETVNCGDSKIYTITPDSGYRIADIGSLKNNGDGTYTLENVTASQTINITFKPDYGNINGDSAVDLKDAVLVLKILSGVDISSESTYLDADVNGDRKIGMEEVIYILNKVADSSSI